MVKECGASALLQNDSKGWETWSNNSIKTPQGRRSRIWSQFALQGNQFRVSDASSVQQLASKSLQVKWSKRLRRLISQTWILYSPLPTEFMLLPLFHVIVTDSSL